MKFTRNASANWQGTGMAGKGTVTTQSTVLDKTPYSFKTRFDNEKGTNPEELIAAAHSGCFTMKLSFVLSELGLVPGNIDTTAAVTFEDGKITNIHLDVKVKIDGITEEKFQAAAKEAKENCPISLLLATEITMTATLVQ